MLEKTQQTFSAESERWLPSRPSRASGLALRLLDETQLPAWDRFVLRHPEAMVQHTSIWLHALEMCFPHIRGMVLAFVDSQSGEIHGGMPLYEVRSRMFGNRIISVPHSTVCPPLIESLTEDMVLLLLESAIERNRECAGRCLELRWNGTTRWPGEAAAKWFVTETTFLHHYVDLERPRSEIWRGLSRSAIRRMIAKAQKAGISVAPATGVDEVEALHRLLAGTRHRLGLPTLPRHFLQRLWKSLGEPHRALWLARKGEKIVGGVFATMAGQMYAIDYYGETKEMRGLGVNSLLYWSAICDAQDAGFKRFSFGRTNTTNDGLLAYKRHWKSVEEEVIYREIGVAAKRGDSKTGLVRGLSKTDIRAVFRRMPKFLHGTASALFYRNWA